MTPGVAVIRLLWCEGLRIRRRDDGSLALVPSELVAPDLLQLARDAKAEIEAAITALPAGGRCPICGEPNGWDEKTQLHCTACAEIAAARRRNTDDISQESAA